MNPYASYLLDKLRNCPPRSLLQTRGAEAAQYREQLRARILTDVMGIGGRSPVRGVVLGEVVQKNFRRQSLVIECEPGSWQPALLYLPVAEASAPLPAVVLASGHGGSKAHGYNQIAAQLYTRLGCAVLLADPIGEEERNEPYGLGLRGHRKDYVVDRMNEAGRPFLGKVVADLRAGLDYLRGRDDIDAARLGCAGSSMGGTLVQLLIAVEPGIRAAVISSWAADYCALDGEIGCCYRLPGLMRYANQTELMALAAPECALLVCAGAQDEVTPPCGLREMGEALTRWWEQRGGAGKFACRIEAAGGHRPYHMTVEGIRWMAAHLGVDSELAQGEFPLRTIGAVYAESGRALEPLYDAERHHRGTLIPDWPVMFEPAEALRVLSPSRLAQQGLTAADFTLSGYLEKCGIAAIDRMPPLTSLAEVPPLPESSRLSTLLPTQSAAQVAAASALRVERALAALAPVPQWLETPAGAWEPDGNGGWSVSLGFAGCRLRVAGGAPADAAHRWLTLARSRAQDSKADATVDLVSFNDNEVLLGEPSLFANLYLVKRAFGLLGQRFGAEVAWSIRSEVPRLGELSFFALSEARSLLVAAAQAVERAGVCVGRAENMVPGLGRYLEWMDVLLALAPRPVTLPRSCLSEGAMSQLAAFDSFTFY